MSLPSPQVDGETPMSRAADDDLPFAALAFKIMSDPFVGSLTFTRIYSGILETGTSVYNSVKVEIATAESDVWLMSEVARIYKTAHDSSVTQLVFRSERHVHANHLSWHSSTQLFWRLLRHLLL